MEQVLVFPTKLLEEINCPNGYIENPTKYLKCILYEDNLTFIDRDIAEQNTNVQQIIPYCVLRWRGEVFTYERTKKSGEDRLHNLLSLGVGGHVNPVDSDSSDNPELLIKDFIVPQIYTNAFYRELKEEIELPEFKNTIIGCIRDTSNEVGKVHFGIVHRLTLEEKNVKTVDPALTDGIFRGIVEIKRDIKKFESWSKLVIEHGL